MIFAVKTNRIICVIVLVSVLVVGMVLLCSSTLAGGNKSIINYTIVIDAGHGGMDGGVVAVDGTKESSLNLIYAQTLGKYFTDSGFNVVQTRKTEGGLYGLPTNGFKMRDMNKRKEIIAESKANIVISVHMNKFANASRKGPQVFYQQGSVDGELLANNIQKVLNAFTGNNHESIDGDYFICRTSSCTSVIVECGFVSNSEELALLKTADYRTALCEKIFQGVMLYLYSSGEQS